MEKNNLVQDLITIRKQLGVSQQELANRIFVNQNTISNYENGKRQLNFEMFQLMLAALGVSFQYQFTLENGEIIQMNKNIELPERPIDPRAIRTAEGFRLWALQYGTEDLRIFIDENRFVVDERNEDEEQGDTNLFWLYDEVIPIRELQQVCFELGIEVEEL